MYLSITHRKSMLKTFVCLLILAVVPASAFSQRTGVWDVIPYPETQNFGNGQQKLISGANSTDIATITDATGGVFQHEVRVTHDSGASWKTLLAEPTSFIRWNSIHHPIPTIYLLTGDSTEYLGHFEFNDAFKYFGLFYFSNDSGKTWKKTIMDSNSIVYSGYMQNELEGALIVGYVGNVYDSAANQLQDSLLVTTDGWKTWTARGLPPGAKACWQVIGLGKGSYLTYSFYPQAVYVTTNNGDTWDVRPGIGSYGIDDIVAVTPDHIIAVGGRWESNDVHTLMYESFDQAKTWTARLDSAVAITSGFSSVSFSEDKLHGVAIGSSIYRTEDGGISWQFDDLPYHLGPYPYPSRGVYCASKDLALAVLSQNELLRFSGKTTLQAPKLNYHEPGPIPIGPTEISWTPIEGATGYRLQVAGTPISNNTYDSTVYRTPVLDTIVSDVSILFNAELASFAYYVRVEAVNNTEHSTWSERAALFYTVSAPGKKLPPKIVWPTSGEHFSDSVTIAWTPVEGASSYEVKIWFEALVPVKDIVVSSTSVTIRDFDNYGMYAVQVRALGEPDSSDWSNGDFYFTVDALGVHELKDLDVAVFPNPAQDVLHVRYPQREPNVNISLYDCMGDHIALPYRREENELVFDLRSIPSGMYLLVIEGSDRITRHISITH